jgi:hypothetical protein
MSYRDIKSKGMMDVINEVGNVWKEGAVTSSKPVPEGSEKNTKTSNQFLGKSSRISRI